MSIPPTPLQCYLVEWYPPELTADRLARIAATLADSAVALSAQGTPVQLLHVLSVPSDETLFGVFAADCAPTVTQACQRAGMPAQRLNDAVDARIAGTS